MPPDAKSRAAPGRPAPLTSAAAKRAEVVPTIPPDAVSGRDALAMAVDGCRARGYSDTEIGMALGLPRESARQAVGQRFGRKRDVHTGTPESGAAG